MATGFLSRLRAATHHALRITAGTQRQTSLDDLSGSPPALLSRLASPAAALVRADASWRPDTLRIRIEIMASGPFENLRGIRAAVNRLQDNMIAAIRQGTLELRLTEVRRTCRHSTAWSREPVDPGASTTVWECLVDGLANEVAPGRTLFAQAFRESLSSQANHIVVFGDRFDDGVLFLNAAIQAFRQHGVRVSTFYLGDDFNGRNMYRFLAASTGGLFMHLSAQRSLDAVLPIVAAFACGDHARLAALPPATPEAKALIAQACRR
jgi:hypothetical protein